MASINEVVSEQISVDFDIPLDLDDVSISIEDCRKILQNYDLTDEQLSLIRNSIIGIADSVINSYIDEYL